MSWLNGREIVFRFNGWEFVSGLTAGKVSGIVAGRMFSGWCKKLFSLPKRSCSRDRKDVRCTITKAFLNQRNRVFRIDKNRSVSGT